MGHGKRPTPTRKVPLILVEAGETDEVLFFSSKSERRQFADSAPIKDGLSRAVCPPEDLKVWKKKRPRIHKKLVECWKKVQAEIAAVRPDEEEG